MHCTIVNFRTTYEDGVQIDGYITRPWGTQRTTHDLMEMMEDAETEKHIFDAMPPDERKVANEMCHAYQGMTLRARFDAVRGPYVFHTEQPLHEDFLVMWAKENLFNKKGGRHA